MLFLVKIYCIIILITYLSICALLSYYFIKKRPIWNSLFSLESIYNSFKELIVCPEHFLIWLPFIEFENTSCSDKKKLNDDARTQIKKILEHIVNIMKERFSTFYLPCTVVHLRGTDRYHDTNIHTLLEKYNRLLPHSKIRVYIVSDSKKMVDAWTRQFPKAELVNKNSCVLKLPAELTTGSHQLSAEILEFYGIDKYTLIVESLTDFMALCYATDVIGDVKSTFYTMPCVIHQMTPETIAQMMPGFLPQRKSLL